MQLASREVSGSRAYQYGDGAGVLSDYLDLGLTFPDVLDTRPYSSSLIRCVGVQVTSGTFKLG